MPRFFFSLFFTCLSSAALADEILFASSTENLREPIIHPEPELVDYLLKEDADFAEQVALCGNEQSNARELLGNTRLDVNGDEVMDHFIRPVLEPFCIYLYGTHTFSYWLVTEKPEKKYEIIFSGFSDAIDILKTRHQNHRDLRVKNATALEMTTYDFQYQDGSYKMTNCTQEEFAENGKSTSKPCDN